MFLPKFYYQRYLVLRADTSKDGRRANWPNGGLQQPHLLNHTSKHTSACYSRCNVGGSKGRLLRTLLRALSPVKSHDCALREEKLNSDTLFGQEYLGAPSFPVQIHVQERFFGALSKLRAHQLGPKSGISEIPVYGGISEEPPVPPMLQTHTAKPIAATFLWLGDLETKLVKNVKYMTTHHIR